MDKATKEMLETLTEVLASEFCRYIAEPSSDRTQSVETQRKELDSFLKNLPPAKPRGNGPQRALLGSFEGLRISDEKMHDGLFDSGLDQREQIVEWREQTAHQVLTSKCYLYVLTGLELDGIGLHHLRGRVSALPEPRIVRVSEAEFPLKHPHLTLGTSGLVVAAGEIRFVAAGTEGQPVDLKDVLGVVFSNKSGNYRPRGKPTEYAMFRWLEMLNVQTWLFIDHERRQVIWRDHHDDGRELVPHGA
jgi:hypothetical protein